MERKRFISVMFRIRNTSRLTILEQNINEVIPPLLLNFKREECSNIQVLQVLTRSTPSTKKQAREFIYLCRAYCSHQHFKTHACLCSLISELKSFVSTNDGEGTTSNLIKAYEYKCNDDKGNE